MEPVKVIYRNLFCYKNLEFSFEGLDFSLFVGDNGVGKSYFFDSMYWIQYGVIPRKRYKGVIRDVPVLQDYAEGEYTGIKDGVEYKILRRIGKGKKLELYVDGIKSDLRNPTLVQAEINRILGVDAKTFLNIAYFSQGDIGTFFNTGGDKLKIITDIFGYDIFDMAVKSVKDEISELDLLMSSAKGKMEAYNDLILNFDIKSMEKKRKLYKGELVTLNDNLVIVSQELAAINEKIDLTAKIEEFKNKIADITDEYNTEKVVHESKVNKIKRLKNKIKKLDDITDGLKIKFINIDGIEKEIDVNNLKLSAKESDLKVYKSKKKDIEKEIDSLEKARLNEGVRCDECKGILSKSDVFSINKIILIRRKKLVKVKDKIYNIENYIGDTEKINVGLNSKFLNMSKHKRVFDNAEKMKVNLKAKIYLLPEIISDFNDYKKRMKDRLKKERKLKNELVKDLKFLKDYDAEKYNEVNKNYDSIQDKIHNAEVNFKYLNNEINRYYDNIKSVKEVEAELDGINSDINVRKIWSDIYPLIKFELISELIPMIESETNKYLSGIFSNKYIKFDFNPDRATNKLSVTVVDRFNDKERDYDGWSGSQKDRMSLSVYLALNRLASNMSQSDIPYIILDEKFSSMDSKVISLVLDTLKDDYKNRKIFAISHVTGIDEYFNQKIHIEMKDGLSYMKTIRSN